jgi:hypothetical protein
MIILAFDRQTYGKVTAMRALGLSLFLACIVALLVLSPRPASAQPSALAGGATTGTFEEVGYRYRGYRGRYGYRPYYRPYSYGYYRPYYRPYYGYGYGYRPYYRPGISLWFGF